MKLTKEQLKLEIKRIIKEDHYGDDQKQAIDRIGKLRALAKKFHFDEEQDEFGQVMFYTNRTKPQFVKLTRAVPELSRLADQEEDLGDSVVLYSGVYYEPTIEQYSMAPLRD